MTTRPKRKKTKAATSRAAAKKSAKKAAAKKKAIGKTRGTKPARRRKAGTPKKTAAPGARARTAVKASKRSARRRLAAFDVFRRRPKAIAGRGPARGRVSPRRLMAKPAARAPRVAGVGIKGAMGPRYAEVLSPAALRFLADLHREFEAARGRCLAARGERQRDDAEELPDFRPGTKVARDDPDRSAAPLLSDLRDRRVAIASPVDRKALVDALKSGACVADFAGDGAPTWGDSLEGQINLKDRWAGKLDVVDSAMPIVRPRGWHLVEQNLTIDGEPMSAALFDFGLCFFHNARTQIAAGALPCFYLPKLETPEEARLWNDVLAFAQERFGLAAGTIRALMLIENPLIETPSAAFELII
jgi:malate synthase